MCGRGVRARTLKVESGELGHVAVGEGLLRAEDGPDLEDLVKVAHQGHLLVELRRLGEVSVTVEVGEAEDVGALSHEARSRERVSNAA